MHQVNIHEAKTQLSKLIEEAAQEKRLSFLKGQLVIPNDFDSMGQ